MHTSSETAGNDIKPIQYRVPENSEGVRRRQSPSGDGLLKTLLRSDPERSQGSAFRQRPVQSRFQAPSWRRSGLEM